MSHTKLIILSLLGLGAVALTGTIGVRSMQWNGICEANRSMFSDDPCAVHALFGAMSQTAPFSWFLSLTPTARSLELIETAQRYDEAVAAGRHADALAHAMRIVWLHTRVFGAHHPGTAPLLDNLAAQHRAAGGLKAAAEADARAAAIRSRQPK